MKKIEYIRNILELYAIANAGHDIRESWMPVSAINTHCIRYDYILRKTINNDALYYQFVDAGHDTNILLDAWGES